MGDSVVPMRRLSRNRQLILLVLVPLVITFISLGIRLPDLSGIHSSGPKPKSRAILSNQIHTCKKTINKIWEPVDVHEPVSLILLNEHYLFRLCDTSKAVITSFAIDLSRAPPFTL